MTLDQCEKIEQSCRRDAKQNPPNGQLLRDAADAIEYLIEQLAQAELEDRYVRHP